MTIELEEVKQFMKDTLDSHSEESRQSIADMSTVLDGAVARASKNEKHMENLQTTLQTMREEGIARTTMLTTNLENITSTVRETNIDVKSLTIETAIQGAQIKTLERKNRTIPPIKSILTQYSSSILGTALLVFVIGMFAVGNIDVVESATKLIP